MKHLLHSIAEWCSSRSSSSILEGILKMASVWLSQAPGRKSEYSLRGCKILGSPRWWQFMQICSARRGARRAGFTTDLGDPRAATCARPGPLHLAHPMGNSSKGGATSRVMGSESSTSRTRFFRAGRLNGFWSKLMPRSEEHTSELQSLRHLVCRLLLEK